MSASLQLTPGLVFAGDFKIIAPLAEGGMGSVYVVEQLSTGNPRALKVMQPALFSDERLRQRFAQEARIGALIESDHVVQVVAAGVDVPSGTPWLAMELLKGETLADAIARLGVLSGDQVHEIFSQLFHALSAAHAAGIVHRDLKPENIFLASSRREGVAFMVKVLDFGIAKLVAEASTRATAAIGTPLWMSPEQTEATAMITPAADVWALGLIAFYALTGRFYWRVANTESVSTMTLLREVLMEPIVPASQRAQEYGLSHLLPPGFDAWFARCLERRVEARFANAHDCRVGFEGVFRGAPSGLSGATIVQPPPPGAPQGAPFLGMPTPGTFPSQPMRFTPSQPVLTPSQSAPIPVLSATPAHVSYGTVAASGPIIPVFPPPPAMPSGPGMAPPRKKNNVLLGAIVAVLALMVIAGIAVTRSGTSTGADTKDDTASTHKKSKKAKSGDDSVDDKSGDKSDDDSKKHGQR